MPKQLLKECLNKTNHILLTNKKIAIIGGGPGGLTLARLLQMQGAHVKIYERDLHQDARAQGATLDLHLEAGLKALQAAGLMSAFEANYRPGADRVRVMDSNASIVFDGHETDGFEASRPEIDRGPLQKILLRSLQAGSVIWDSHFTALKPYKNGWNIEFKNGSFAYADMVIAADGANSKLRPYVTMTKPFYTGITAVEGAVNAESSLGLKLNEILNGGKIFAFGNQQSIIVSAKGDGSMNFYTGFKTSENWVRESDIDFNDKMQVLSWFRQEFAVWDELWLELFENASYAFYPRPQYCMPVNEPWKTLPNLTMIGDAAHLMPPYAGEGVNMAMLDALELSECLADKQFNSLQKALSAFEQQMHKRSAEAATLTLESTKVLHSTDAIEYLMNVMG